jgi:phosphinothricin acetyltransferase
MQYSILPMLSDHWPAVREIYGQGIATGNATFETELPDWEKWDTSHRKDCRLVSVETSNQQSVFGWAALSPVSSRHVYRGVAEVSVYVSSAARGRGVGTALLQALVREAEGAGIWTLQAGIFPENTASISLHKSCGFREVGLRQKIGMLKSVWRDVLLLERRGPIVS